MEIKDIENLIGEGIQSPQIAADLRVELSAKYSRECGKLEDILKVKPKIWLEMREKCKSDSSCNKLWEATELGTDEMVTRLRLKRVEKLIGALTGYLKVKEGEARNQY